MTSTMSLVDAPPGYREIPDLDQPEHALCGDCARPVTGHPCPLHGPEARIEPPAGDLPLLTETDVPADVMDLARVAHYVITHRDTRLDPICHHLYISQHAVSRYLKTLETQWKILGRVHEKGLPRTVIHPDHANRVATTIVRSRGVPFGVTPFAHITVPPLAADDYRLIDYIADGMSNAAIAVRDQRPIETVRSHISRVLQLCGARNRTNLVKRAFVLGVFGGIPREAWRPRG